MIENVFKNNSDYSHYNIMEIIMLSRDMGTAFVQSKNRYEI